MINKSFTVSKWYKTPIRQRHACLNVTVNYGSQLRQIFADSKRISWILLAGGVNELWIWGLMNLRFKGFAYTKRQHADSVNFPVWSRMNYCICTRNVRCALRAYSLLQYYATEIINRAGPRRAAAQYSIRPALSSINDSHVHFSIKFTQSSAEIMCCGKPAERSENPDEECLWSACKNASNLEYQTALWDFERNYATWHPQENLWIRNYFSRATLENF